MHMGLCNSPVIKAIFPQDGKIHATGETTPFHRMRETSIGVQLGVNECEKKVFPSFTRDRVAVSQGFAFQALDKPKSTSLWNSTMQFEWGFRKNWDERFEVIQLSSSGQLLKLPTGFRLVFGRSIIASIQRVFCGFVTGVVQRSKLSTTLQPLQLVAEFDQQVGGYYKGHQQSERSVQLMLILAGS
ncbi:hypothetical protein PtA15_18A455 [Puccinia triticina]|uniref:Uncharacterized protein n=1 Tax=Puccinia triticina TaxID=208348 RepID=A0ABY7D6X8_9BASI|nr:uncharacterized protein PtA15_18A455 [Puccinia triticina]WAQ93394.1 hypothetical protein PtA15_18A455 [Puccinia triticina]WAR63393.1 hypothetical protein PtB15_18B479 [Puccinia triticina]